MRLRQFRHLSILLHLTLIWAAIILLVLLLKIILIIELLIIWVHTTLIMVRHRSREMSLLLLLDMWSQMTISIIRLLLQVRHRMKTHSLCLNPLKLLQHKWISIWRSHLEHVKLFFVLLVVAFICCWSCLLVVLAASGELVRLLLAAYLSFWGLIFIRFVFHLHLVLKLLILHDHVQIVLLFIFA